MFPRQPPVPIQHWAAIRRDLIRNGFLLTTPGSFSPNSGVSGWELLHCRRCYRTSMRIRSCAFGLSPKDTHQGRLHSGRTCLPVQWTSTSSGRMAAIRRGPLPKVPQSPVHITPVFGSERNCGSGGIYAFDPESLRPSQVRPPPVACLCCSMRNHPKAFAEATAPLPAGPAAWPMNKHCNHRNGNRQISDSSRPAMLVMNEQDPAIKSRLAASAPMAPCTARITPLPFSAEPWRAADVRSSGSACKKSE